MAERDYQISFETGFARQVEDVGLIAALTRRAREWWRLSAERTPVNEGPWGPSKIIRKVRFRFPGGHGQTFVESLGKERRCRDLSIWFGQTVEDVNRYRWPRYTLSLRLYREPTRPKR